ncbi:uncharacterized protein stard9 isoform X3 [Halichoeres trimaculatus]
MVITLGGEHKFRFNHPAEAAVLRERRRASESGTTCAYIDLCPLSLDPSEEGAKLLPPSEEPTARRRVEEQQLYVESLRQEIQAEQRRAERELEKEQAHLRQQHSEIQLWILQEKQRLTAVEQRVTHESGVQTDLLPVALQERPLTPEDQEGRTIDRLPLVVRARKRTVHEELLKHHALCRAESRIRRKRLHYQLERIARKRHLLEAKRELQRLERDLPPGPESPESPESPTKARGRQSVSRRHSFSADILSRLYPQNTPIFRHFLQRNRSTEISSSSSPPEPGGGGGRKWLSDECLPRERTQSCSAAVSSGPSPESRSRSSSCENIKPSVRDEPRAQPSRERPERKPLLPNRDLSFRTRSDQSPALSLRSPVGTSVQTACKENLQEPKTSEPSCQTVPCPGQKPQSFTGTRGVLRKTLSQSVGPRLKTALSKVFKKPPPGADGGRRPRPVGRITNRFTWRPRTEGGRRRVVQSAVSCEELDHGAAFEDRKQRRWHSTEALTETSRWLETQPGLTGWEEEDGEEGMSDCESLFSLDSLSSAYASALAEQLRHEEAAQSDTESEDSHMSKDSLTVGSSGRVCVSGRLSQRLAPTYSLVTEGSGSSAPPGGAAQTSCSRPQETPTERDQSQHSVTRQLPPKNQQAADPRSRDPDPRLVQDFRSVTLSPRPHSSCSSKEPENTPTLTDAWSSAEAADGLTDRTLILCDPETSSPSPTSPDLSQSGPRSCSSASSSSDGAEKTRGKSETSDSLNSELHPSREDAAVQEEGRCLDQSGLREEGGGGACDDAPDHSNNMSPASSPALNQTTCEVPAQPGPAGLTKSSQTETSNYHFSTCPTHQGPALRTNPDPGPAQKPPVKDGELCSLGCSMDELKDFHGCDFGKTHFPPKDRRLDEAETKGSEAPGAGQRELVKPSCKISRKRNKERQDSFMGSLKIPKWTKRKETLTLCPPPTGSQDAVWPDNNNNSTDRSKEEADSRGFDSVCVRGRKRQGGAASVAAPVYDPVSGKLGPSVQIFEDFECVNKCCQRGTSAGEQSAPLETLGAERKDEPADTNGERRQTDHTRKYQESRKRSSKSDAICSAIDLRISEVVKEHMRLNGSTCERRSCSLSALSSAGFRGDHERPPGQEVTHQLTETGTGGGKLGEHRLLDAMEGENQRPPSDPPAESEPAQTPETDQEAEPDHSFSDPASDQPTHGFQNCSNQTAQTNPTGHRGSEVSTRPGLRPGGLPSMRDRSAQRQPPQRPPTEPETGPQVISPSGGDRVRSSAGRDAGTQRGFTAAEVIQQTPNETPSSSGDTKTNAVCGGLRGLSESTWRPGAEDGDSCQSGTVQPLRNRPGAAPGIVSVSPEGNVGADVTAGGQSSTPAPGRSDGSPPSSNCSTQTPQVHTDHRNSQDASNSAFDKDPQQRPEPEHRGGSTNQSEELRHRRPQTSCRFSDRLTHGSMKTRTKRVRRSKIQTHPSSSSESSLKSSDLDEDDGSDRRKLYTGLSSKLVKLGHQRDQEGGQTRTLSPEVYSDNRPRSDEAHIPNPGSPPAQGTTQNAAVRTYAVRSQDSSMHFASSDINPFVHQRQEDDASQLCFKTPAFGSAADLSSKSPLLDRSEKRITRCCSVDDGLNEQNSPFTSHLSAYAAHRGLSSTLSSVEDYRDASSKGAAQRAPETHRPVQTRRSLSDHHGVGTSSCRVDGSRLVYSGEETQRTETRTQSGVCDHATQTKRSLHSSSAPKRTERHRRSQTEKPAAQKTRTDFRESPTWASMETMSVQLSRLIHSTSDLLDDVQGMRSGESLNATPRRSLNLSDASQTHRQTRDGSTQTSRDAAVQTEESEQDASAHQTPSAPTQPQEVSVVVRVVGSEVVSVSEDRGVSCALKNKTNTPERARLSAADTRSDGQTAAPPESGQSPAGRQRRVQSASSRPPKISPSDVQEQRSAAMREVTQRSVRKQEADGKQAAFTDRASSPILTVSAKLRLKQRGNLPTPCPPTPQEAERDGLTSGASGRSAASDRTPGEDHHAPSCRSGSLSLEKVSDVSLLSPEVDSSGLTSSLDVYSSRRSVRYDGDTPKRQRSAEEWTAFTVQDQLSPILRPPDGPKAGCSETCSFRGADPESVEFYVGSFDQSPASNGAVQLQEDDMASLAPSECNTDILVNIKPLTSVSPCQDQQTVPEDLPLHNKFTNWSGISQELKACSRQTPCAPCVRSRRSTDWETESSSSHLEPAVQSHRRAREIQRLRTEREQVMASVSLSINPTPLTVELAEAKLHYGLGETDTLLKMLSPRSREEPGAASAPSKQQLYDRHRRSIQGLRRDREERLQTYRRARSLSPSKHVCSSPHEEVSSSSRPSAGRQNLHQLQASDSVRATDPPRGDAQCPADIEQLLRDYGRAREEARTEIAKARERLRERTEQEKRRLQQQALSQEVQDDLKHRTRISNSTLCSGSTLSLSSGPTSGYNSGNTVQLQGGSRTLINGQVAGIQDEGLKVRTRPPACGPQSVKTQRAWLSAHDVRLEPPVAGFEPLMTSTPSPAACPRQRAASFGSSSSISSTYQDITSALLGRALAEVRLASSGDLSNLVSGRATAGWRHQGEERGIQAFYKPSSSPSVHAFLGAGELSRPLDGLWSVICQLSKSHVYNQSVRSVWTRPLDDSTQLVYILTDPSSCHLSQPRDFCCISTESRQGACCVLAMQSVFEETLPRPSVDAVRGEMMPSCWLLQPLRRNGREVTRVVYLLQVDVGTPSFPPRLLSSVSRRQAAVIADLDAFLRPQSSRMKTR